MKTLLIFASSYVPTNFSHPSPYPPLKSATINFNKWKIHYSLLPSKLLGILACTMQIHRKKKKVNILNGEESQGQDKKADEFPQHYLNASKVKIS